MNLVFCGTPQFAAPTLEKLVASGFVVHLVLSQPDRPKGRGLELVSSPIKQSALKLGLPVYQPEKIKTNEELRAKLEAIKPDAIIVVGYGRIIPKWMLDLPKYGNINLHGSLLPKYRGAAPIQWAIANGETATGVTTMRIDEGLDTGDILLQTQLPVAPDETSVSLAPRLAEIGADLVIETLRGLADNSVTPRKQDDTQATLAPILKKDDGRIDFTRSAQEIYNRFRGFQPWPGAFSSFRGKNLNITSMKPAPEPMSATAPAELLVKENRIFAGSAGNTVIELLEVQPEGKKRITSGDFIRGYRPHPGETLGTQST